MTREGVRQIEAKAVRKLQNPVRSQILESFVPDRQLLPFPVNNDFDPAQQDADSEADWYQQSRAA